MFGKLGLGLGLGGGGGAKPAIFTFTSKGSGEGTGTLYLFYPASEDGKVVRATGNVKLGADGDLTEQPITGGTTNTFIVTCSSGTGTLVLPNTYTRFSANTSDTGASNGWVTSANSPSLAFDIASLPVGLITFRCEGLNTISGKLPSDWKSMTYFYCKGSNTIGGNLPADWKSMTYFRCLGSNTVDGITDGEYAGNQTSSMLYLQLASNNNLGGLSAKDQEFLLKGKASRTWTSYRVFDLASPSAAMASMADEAIPGRWFSSAGEPTEVAQALKTLVKEKNVSVVLKGLTMPGESGDGVGFPTGFGDWWRS